MPAQKPMKAGRKDRHPIPADWLDCGDEQAPHRGRHHHSRRKAGQGALHALAQRVFHEEDAGRAQRRPEKRD